MQFGPWPLAGDAPSLIARAGQVGGNPPGCCHLCVAAAKVAPADVYRIAEQWEWQTTATRMRALR